MLRWLLAVCILAAAALPAPAQQADVATANRQALADAIARILIGKVAQGPFEPGVVTGGTSDLNHDGFGEEFVYLAADPCNGVDCGLFTFVLIGDAYSEVIGSVTGARTSSPNSLIDRKRKGYLDIRFGQVDAGWDGSRYVDLATLPRATLSADAFTAACMARADNDYAFEQAGADIQGSRAIICSCSAERFADVGLPQAQLDLYSRYLGGPGDGPEFSDDAFDDLLNQANDIQTGCLVEQGWSSWNQPYGVNDAQEPQQPLAFDAFLQACASTDWLIASRRVGSADRALGLCGCLGRKLAAQGFDQPKLDGLTGYYRGELGESEVDEIDPGIMATSDKEADACASQLPPRT